MDASTPSPIDFPLSSFTIELAIEEKEEEEENELTSNVTFE